MKRNTFLDRLNPFARRANRPENRRGPRRLRRLAFEKLEPKNLLATFTVNSVDDTVDANVGDGFALDEFGNTTLRAAIMEANATTDTDQIVFDIPGGTITLGGDPLLISETISIVGPTDDLGDPLITIDAGNFDPNTTWRVMRLGPGTGDSELRNFRISNVQESGIALEGGKTVVENLDISGTGALYHVGIDVRSDGNEIRGVTAAMPWSAIEIANAHDNIVEHCDLRNSGIFLSVTGDSSRNIFRENNWTPGDPNAASGNPIGVLLYGGVTGKGNQIIHNDLSNTVYGINATFGNHGASSIEELLVVRENVIEDAQVGLKFTGLQDIDLVAGSDFDVDVRNATRGLILVDASDVRISGFDLSADGKRPETIGLHAYGTNTNVTIENIDARGRGIGIATENLNGGEISFVDLSWTGDSPTGVGLQMFGCDNVLVHDDVVVENHWTGMWFAGGSSNVTVYGNEIANNNDGIVVSNDSSGIRIQRNSIHSNSRLGIAFHPVSGFTPNDPGDTDTGGNSLQNFPVLSEVDGGATTTIRGILNSTPGDTFTLDFYANTKAGSSGYGEGERWIGSTTVATDAAGDADFAVELAQASAGGEFISATATGPDGTSEFSAVLEITNTPPIADAGGPYTVGEGSPLTLDASASSDSDGDPLIYRWDFNGDGLWDTFWSTDPTFTYAWPDDYTGTATVEVSDRRETATDTATVTVTNVAPTVGTIASPVDPTEVGAIVSVSSSFTDPGVLDTHTAVWDWGDNSTSDGRVTEADGSGTLEGSHGYASPGVYTVTLTVTDDDGDSGQSVFDYVVVFDPNGGFVTGGGWITSPEGAYAPDPTLNGKANFGFVAKYKKGASVPEGQTQFQFKVADLNFFSDSYQWLVVAGHTAKFKGNGTINGAGNYGFMISAIDEALTPGADVDCFRIKIWDKDDGDAVVYDNQMGDEDDADATTEIGGGNIFIHDGGNNLNSAKVASTEMVGHVLTPTMLVPVVDQAISYWESRSIDVAAIQNVDVHPANLNGSVLGIASSSNMIWIDRDAAGYGWQAGAHSGGLDLLHVVTHEFGHKLGLVHDGAFDVMRATLAPLVTRGPVVASVMPATNTLESCHTALVQGPPLLDDYGSRKDTRSSEGEALGAFGGHDELFARLADGQTDGQYAGDARRGGDIREALWEQEEVGSKDILEAELLDSLLTIL